MTPDTMGRRLDPRSRATSLAVMWGAYLWAIAVSFAIGSLLPLDSSLVKAGVVDLIATVLIFAVSVSFDNSSIYDPYWSLAPIVMAGYWVWSAHEPSDSSPRALIVLTLVTVWGVRLTANFVTNWKGIRHEDWRYADFRDRVGRLHWVVSFFGFHLVPTVIVFAGCLPIYIACTGRSPIGWMDAVAIVITVIAIVIEAVADAQMRGAVARGSCDGTTFRGGLWAYSRHPNYFGEVVFWWGMFLFGLTADRASWWTVIGPIGVTLLFLTVSIPLIEARMARRRSDYEQVREETPLLIPGPPK